MCLLASPAIRDPSVYNPYPVSVPVGIAAVVAPLISPPCTEDAARVRVFAASLCVAVRFVPPTIKSATRSRTASLRSTFADPSNA